jgi:GxxExxY protein
MRVHNKIGMGFKENIYQRALTIEMTNEGLRFVREYAMNIFYGGQNIGTRRVDFLVENKVLIELKALPKIDNIHKNQIINYLEICNIEVGLLINFGQSHLEFKRFIKTRNRKYFDCSMFLLHM